MSSGSGENLVASIDLDPDGYFEGLSKQSMKFHNALAELIDNSISANINADDYFEDENPNQNFRVQITIERYQNQTDVIVADAGGGITTNGLANTILQQGDREEADGILNEHGMGLKNSLAVLTRNEGEEPFKIISKSPDDPQISGNEYVYVSGPFSEEMPIQHGDDPDVWKDGAGALETLEQGSRIHLTTTHEMVRSSWRSAQHLSSIVPGLREHLGTIYRKFLTHSDNNHIHLHWQDNIRGDSGQEQVKPVWPVFKDGSDANGRNWHEENQIEVDDRAGNTYLVEYNRGIVDWDATRERYESGEFEGLAAGTTESPFRIYYKGNQSTQGVDIVYNGRTLNTALMDEIWDSTGRDDEALTPHNRFNDFVGEIVITDEAFETVNNKIEINQESHLWRQVKNELNESEDYHPRAHGKKEKENSIKKRLKRRLEAIASTDSVHREYGCDNGVDVDLLHVYEEGYEHVFEVKRGKASPLDAYQLTMYWDSYSRVNDSNLTKGLLVADGISGNAEAMINRWNTRTDENDDEYNLEFQDLSNYDISP